MASSNLLAISDVPVDRKFVIFADYIDGFYFADHVDENLLKAIPRITDDARIKLDHDSPDVCTLSYWTKPFNQEMYKELLMEYARIKCGKSIEYGSEDYMLKNEWTEHTINL